MLKYTQIGEPCNGFRRTAFENYTNENIHGFVSQTNKPSVKKIRILEVKRDSVTLPLLIMHHLFYIEVKDERHLCVTSVTGGEE